MVVRKPLIYTIDTQVTTSAIVSSHRDQRGYSYSSLSYRNLSRFTKRNHSIELVCLPQARHAILNHLFDFTVRDLIFCFLVLGLHLRQSLLQLSQIFWTKPLYRLSLLEWVNRLTRSECKINILFVVIILVSIVDIGIPIFTFPIAIVTDIPIPVLLVILSVLSIVFLIGIFVVIIFLLLLSEESANEAGLLLHDFTIFFCE